MATFKVKELISKLKDGSRAMNTRQPETEDRLSKIENKLDGIVSGDTPATTRLSGSKVVEQLWKEEIVMAGTSKQSNVYMYKDVDEISVSLFEVLETHHSYSLKVDQDTPAGLFNLTNTDHNGFKTTSNRTKVVGDGFRFKVDNKSDGDLKYNVSITMFRR
ncbi:hypothetical protein GCM10028778_11690 [Barrientosiimonas marina]|uniref:Tail fiber protein n=1 Tax=Lentibacillus kimchii TaxID=1542911 RepID=A0ABW2UYH9_9BACI